MPSATPRRPCLVSRLASRDCSSIKNALRSLIGGFVGSDVEIEADDEDDEDGQGQVRRAWPAASPQRGGRPPLTLAERRRAGALRRSRAR